MKDEPVKNVRCPNCRKVLRYRDIRDIEHFPFCSERCKMVDLGRWLTGQYSIADDEKNDDEEKKNS